MDERVGRRLEWRRSNACAPRRNRYRESKSGEAPWNTDEWHDLTTGEETEEWEQGE
jgi:hypothetical protein